MGFFDPLLHKFTIRLMERRILEPLAIMFSGGRTSAYMLRQIADIYGGALPSDGSVVVLFQNTGKEVLETLNFVRDVEEHCDIPITWLEYSSRHENKLRVVTYNSASKAGEPFWDLFTTPIIRMDKTLGVRGLPSPQTRICTAELKIKIADRYLRRVLNWPRNYYSATGLRYDERPRVVRQRVDNGYGFTNIHPLYNLQKTSSDVASYWSSSNFDLNLSLEQPRYGNCDLCFLKGAEKIKANIAERPDIADWWIALEEYPRDRNSLFRNDRPSYRELKEKALAGDLGFEKENPFINDCSCTE